MSFLFDCTLELCSFPFLLYRNSRLIENSFLLLILLLASLTILHGHNANLTQHHPRDSISIFADHLVTARRLLRAELQNLKKRSVLKAGNSLDNPVIVESNRSCARCRTYLGRIINRGAPCRACKLRVCKGCREFTNKTDWLCVVCSKQM